MNLSSSLIVSRLTGRFLFDLKGKLNNSMNLSRPVNITDDTVFQDGGIYVGSIRKNDKLPNLALHSMLITSGHLLDAAPSRFECILIFDEKETMASVINYIHSLFSLYETWYDNIMELSLSGASISEFIECSQPIFGNPLKIHDKDFKFIAYSSIIDTNPKLRFLQTDSTPQDILNDYMMDREYRDTFDETSGAIFPAQLTGHRTAYYNVFHHDHFFCRILVIETIRNLEPGDLIFLEILGEKMKHVITHENTYAENSVNTLNRLLLQVLNGTLKNDLSIVKQFGSFGWTSECRYLCFQLTLDKTDLQNLAVSKMVEKLEHMIPGCCALEYNHDMVMYVNLTRSSQSAEAVINSMKEFIRDNNIRAGVSDVYTGLIEIFPLLYKQASIALDVGLRYAPYQWIHLYRDNLQNYLLECCTKELPAQLVICPEIMHIHEYDQTHEGSDYLRTLKVYLENNMQPVATSRQLFIHRTTFLYRMDKMIEKFHLHLDIPQTRLMYELSILLIERT